MSKFAIVRYSTAIDPATVLTLITEIQCGEFGATLTADYITSLKNIIPYFLDDNCKHINFWVAVHDKQIVGCIGLKSLNAHEAEIKRFFIHKDFRGTGISSALMQTAIDAAKTDHKTALYLGTATSRDRAIAFYIKKGFIEVWKQELPQEYAIDPLDNCFFKLVI